MYLLKCKRDYLVNGESGGTDPDDGYDLDGDDGGDGDDHTHYDDYVDDDNDEQEQEGGKAGETGKNKEAVYFVTASRQCTDEKFYFTAKYFDTYYDIGPLSYHKIHFCTVLFLQKPQRPHKVVSEQNISISVAIPCTLWDLLALEKHGWHHWVVVLIT